MNGGGFEVHTGFVGYSRGRGSNGGGIGLFQVSGIAEPVQVLGIFEELVDILTVVVPGGWIFGIDPGGEAGHVRDAGGA